MSDALTPASDAALERRVRMDYLYAPEDRAVAAELLAARKLTRAMAEEFAGEAFANLEEDGPNSSKYLEDYLAVWGEIVSPAEDA